jgi:hypothetical protein
MISFNHTRSGRRKEISNDAYSIGCVFNVACDGNEFLEKVISQFDCFEKLFTTPGYETLWNDVSYIIQCTTESLTSPVCDIRFQNCVDAYFYIHNKVENYFDVKKLRNNFNWEDEADMNHLRKEFMEKLANTFTSTKGTELKFCTNNVQLLKSLNISKYLSLVKTIDSQSIHLFFAICKLLFQSSLICYGYVPHWESILSQKSFAISLNSFVSYYNNYRETFQNFPLNTQTILYLIQKIHPHKQGQLSRLLPYHAIANNLNLNLNEFFEHFRMIFRDGVIRNCYDCKEIAQLLWIMSTHASMFVKYLTVYYKNLTGSKNDIWIVFFHLTEGYQINETIQKQFVLRLTEYIQKLPINEFLSHIQETKKHSEKIQPENYAYYTIIIGEIFENFIKTLLNREEHSNRLSDIDWKELLKNNLQLSTTCIRPQTSTLLIIRRLSFQHNNPTWDVVNRIYNLFQSLKDFSEDPYKKYDPTDIVRDEWLQDFLIDIPQEFCTRLTHHAYRNLHNIYQDNRWTRFVWSRIMDLSILKSKSGNSNNMLLKLNQWMIDVKHDVFHTNDILTIIFIGHLFEIIIKDTKSVLSLPNIPCIIDFIFNIRKEQTNGINTQEMDEFIQSGQRVIYDTLLLEGKLNF